MIDPDGSSGSQPLQKTYFAYDEGQIVVQFDDSIAGSSAKLTHRYLWGSAVDQILAEETHIKQGNNNPTWSQPGTTFWPMTDHLGTIRDWGQVYGYAAAYGAPAQRTQVVKHREYDTFGNIVAETNRADFNNDGKINAVDIDLLAVAVNAGSTNLLYDLNGDGLVNANQAGFDDLEELVLVILNTYFGDANLDGQYNTTDLVQVFAGGEYEDAFFDNSTWAEGDWNGDGDFDSGDFTMASSYGGYDQPNRGGGAFDVYRDIFAFTGRPVDGSIGLQNNLHRWYDPRTGRWISEDPIGFDAGDANIYRYVGNQTTSRVDPLGLWSDTPNKAFKQGIGTGGAVSTLSTAPEADGVIVVGFMGNGAPTNNQLSGVYNILLPTALDKKHDVFEVENKADYQTAMKPVIQRHLDAAAKRRDCKLRVILVGHSNGGLNAINAADWFDREISASTGANQRGTQVQITPDIHLVTIDAVRFASDILTDYGRERSNRALHDFTPVTTGPMAKVTTFINYFQTISNPVRGAKITGAENNDVGHQTLQNIPTGSGETAHTWIDNYLASGKLPRVVQQWAKRK